MNKAYVESEIPQIFHSLFYNLKWALWICEYICTALLLRDGTGAARSTHRTDSSSNYMTALSF